MDFKFYSRPETLVGHNVEHIFETIAKAFEREPHLLPVTASELIRSFSAGLSLVVLQGNKPVGHTRLILLTAADETWYELGSTWVHDDCRGHGLNEHMYREFLTMHTEKNVLATTTNNISRAVGVKMGFVQLPRRTLPEEVWRASCTCPKEKTGVSNNENCRLADGEPQQCQGPCWFRITKETAERLVIDC